MKIALAVLVASLWIGGCANLNSIYRTFDVSQGNSPMVDIRQRAILVAPNKTVTEEFDTNGKLTMREARENGVFVCAEPSPDAMASLAYELAAKGAIPEKASGELAFALQDSAAFTGIRTQSIQLLRDFGYRLCESRLSGAITSAQYDLLMRRYQKNIVALLAIEQLTGTVKAPPVVLTASGKAEATKSLAEQRAERERVGDQIAELERQKEGVKKKHDEAKAANADTSAMDGQLADFDGKIARLKSDIEVIDKAITGTKGILAEGKTEVIIKTDSATQRSDEHIAKVADAVREIVNNIVLSDDVNQICMSVLQSPAAKTKQKELSEWCIATLNNQAAAKTAYIAQLKDDLVNAKARASAASTTPAEKTKAEQTIEEVRKMLEAEGRGANTYSAPFKFDK